MMSKDNLFEGDWIIDEADSGAPSEGHYGWIEVHCPMCGTDFGLEEGQYGWYYGDPFPYLFCPICGDDKREYYKRMEHSQEEYFKDLNEMADAMADALRKEHDNDGVQECDVQSGEKQVRELFL